MRQSYMESLNETRELAKRLAEKEGNHTLLGAFLLFLGLAKAYLEMLLDQEDALREKIENYDPKKRGGRRFKKLCRDWEVVAEQIRSLEDFLNGKKL